jgi:hypothetical protein
MQRSCAIMVEALRFRVGVSAVVQRVWLLQPPLANMMADATPPLSRQVLSRVVTSRYLCK